MKNYTINITLTSEDDEDLMEDWSFDVVAPANITPFELSRIAKDGAADAIAAMSCKVDGGVH